MTNWNITAGANGVNLDGLMSGIDNDQGTIRQGGAIADTDRFSSDAVNLGSSYYITLPSGLPFVDSPLAAGAYNGGTQVIVRVTDSLAGVVNNVLLAGASNSANASNSINQVASANAYYYKTAVRSGGWNEFSGVFDPAVTVANSGYWSQATDTDVSAVLVSSGVDNAANPTAAQPGELVYRDGSPNPVQDDYKAKTNY